MMSSTNSKKRRAPGSSPIQNQHISAQQNYQNLVGFSDPSQLSNDQFMAWGQSAPTASYDANAISYGFNAEGLMAPPAPIIPSLKTSPSTELIRLNNNNSLALQARANMGVDSDAWPPQNDAAGTDANRPTEGDNLDARAAAAKQDAITRKPPKQIPPFIQKLRR